MKSIIIICSLLFLLLLYLLFKNNKLLTKGINNNTYPLDVVITYVNGNDIEWKNNKKEDMNKFFDPNINNHDSIHPNRFRSMDELKYALRSIEKFVPWTRNIYLVVATEKQIPNYLDTSPIINKKKNKLKIILHKDIIPKEYLPTYNSHAIEANIHRIPGLSKIFLYMNDDIFFGRPINMNDFMDDDGNFKFFPCNKPAPKGKSEVMESGHASAWKNVNNYLDQNYRTDRRERIHHTASVLSVKLINKIWKDMNKELTNTSKSRFRSINDYALTCALHQYISYYEKLGVPSDVDIIYAEITNDPEMNDMKFEKIKDRPPFMFCLNDTSNDMSPETRHQFIEFLEDYFPDKSSFEIIPTDEFPKW